MVLCPYLRNKFTSLPLSAANRTSVYRIKLIYTFEDLNFDKDYFKNQLELNVKRETQGCIEILTNNNYKR